MAYKEFTSEVYISLRNEGIKYMANGRELKSEDVEFNEGAAIRHFQLIPYSEKPDHEDTFHDITSPEIVDMVNGEAGHVCYWIKS